MELEPDVCSLCGAEFSLEDEGGISFCIGILPFKLCPTCYNGLIEMFESVCCQDCEEAPNGKHTR